MYIEFLNIMFILFICNNFVFIWTIVTAWLPTSKMNCYYNLFNNLQNELLL